MKHIRFQLLRRAGGAALLIALCLTLALALPQRAFAATQADAAMDKLVNWGVVRGYPDGGLYPNHSITRAEFVAMINRAYGYSEQGPTPFRDVPYYAWYADDISKAYTAGYFTGVSRAQAAPNSPLTREQALVLLAKSIRLETSTGEVTEFADGHDFSDWSRGYVKSAVAQKIINGYGDNTFRPRKEITRGEMAILLSRTLGNLINTPGSHTMSEVFGNVTISSPDVELHDSTIAGDLIISGGLELGDVKLNNVRVLGSIIVAGGGESASGDDSVVLQNVEADRLLVDSIRGQYLSLRAEGNTSIPETSLHTDSFLLDRTQPGTGLETINVESNKPGGVFTLSGNLETVVNKSPNSTLNIATGTLRDLTVDEQANGSKLNLGINSTVKTLNLDTATPITGTGDIDQLNVNTAGSTSAMLPDKITIRPGVTANIAGENMDTLQAQESSADPRLLAGYPKTKNVAPNTATAVFSTNKSGTVYWAVSTTTDGSIPEDELITPTTGNTRITANGNLKVTKSNTEFTADIKKLTTDGNYYLSAVLVDARGKHSPVKTISFHTPDNTVPNFNSGYPQVTQNTYDKTVATTDKCTVQVAASTTKNCQLYYALYEKGSSAPTPAQFRSGSLGGNLGFGVRDMTRNAIEYLNFARLEEVTTYDLYLWLTDADGAKSSSVKKVTFTTTDGTPPKFNIHPMVSKVAGTSLGLTANLNEKGTIYWSVVPAGVEFPKDPPNNSTAKVDEYHILQIVSGTNAIKHGSVSASKPNTDVTFNVSGLVAETEYDIWYIAKDAAGNYSEYPYSASFTRDQLRNACRGVCMLTANTLDNIPPTARQEFTSFSGTKSNEPYANTDVHIIFSENVERYADNKDRVTFLDLYNNVVNAANDAARAAAKNALGEALSNTILLYNATDSPTKIVEPYTGSAKGSEPWTIDYREVEVTQQPGERELLLNFPYGKAINLSSGSTYYFALEGIADASSSRNLMGRTTLPRFTTISAQAQLKSLNVNKVHTDSGEDVELDLAYSMTPLSTNVDENVDWDMIFWSDTPVKFDLYARVGDEGDWTKVGSSEINFADTDTGFFGRSLYRHFYGRTYESLAHSLEAEIPYEYGIHFTELQGVAENSAAGRDSWSRSVNFEITVLTGTSGALSYFASGDMSESSFADAKADPLEPILEIGVPEEFVLRKQFTDSRPPEFAPGFPNSTPLDTALTMNLQLSRPGTIYYVIAPVGSVITQKDGKAIDFSTAGVPDLKDLVSNSGLSGFLLDLPVPRDIYSPRFSNSDIKVGNITVGTGSVPVTVTELNPETDYFAYFVLRGTGQVYSDYVELYKFTTTAVNRPVITLDLGNPIVNISSDRDASVDYMVVNYNSSQLNSLLKEKLNDHAIPALPDTIRGKNYTVLEAMATNVPNETGTASQGSVFDLYGAQDHKDDVAAYIRASSANTAGTIIGVDHEVSVRGNGRVSVDCSRFPMSAGTQYAFLAVGRSILGSGDAFRAIYPVTLVDNEAPKIIAINDTLTMIGDGDSANSCEGSISLTFNEYLYSYDDSTQPPARDAIDRGPINDTGRNEGYISIGSLLQSSKNLNIHTSDGETNKTTTVVDIDVTNATNGSYITFRPTLCDQFSNMRNTPLTVTVKIVNVREETGEYDDKGNPKYRWVKTPTVTVTNSWDARDE